MFTALKDTQALPVFPLQSDFLGGSEFLTKGKFLSAANRPSNLIRECSISKGLLSFHVSSPQLRQEREVSCFLFWELSFHFHWSKTYLRFPLHLHWRWLHFLGLLAHASLHSLHHLLLSLLSQDEGERWGGSPSNRHLPGWSIQYSGSGQVKDDEAANRRSWGSWSRKCPLGWCLQASNHPSFFQSGLGSPSLRN